MKRTVYPQSFNCAGNGFIFNEDENSVILIFRKESVSILCINRITIHVFYVVCFYILVLIYTFICTSR